MAQQDDATIAKNVPRDSDLQNQVEELRQALQEWRRKREYSQATEERLAKITVQCARMVETWQQMEQRRGAIGAGSEERGAERGDAEGRHADVGERIRALDRTLEQEWEALPQGHDERASLAESCVTAAELTLRGFARAESRLAALEHDLQTRMSQLSSDMQSVVAELRSVRPQRLPGAASAFPLESVMRIHEELREADATAGADAAALKAAPARTLPQLPESATALTARVESLERAVAGGGDAAVQPRGRLRLYPVIGLLVILAGVALFGLWMQRRVDQRLSDAALRVSAAERERDAATAATRQEAAREVAEARQSAAQAQIVGNVLAAPDLVRYWLTGVNAESRAFAQVLFSRSRGMVFSASRLPAAGAGRTYQLWLLTRDGPVAAGLITPDTAGRVTIASDVPLTVPSRLMGALVTLEPEGGGAEPSVNRVLIRAVSE